MGGVTPSLTPIPISSSVIPVQGSEIGLVKQLAFDGV